MSKLRTFVATPVIDIEYLKKWVFNLRKQPVSGKIKWTNPDLWHLTFKFIGDIEKGQLSSLIESMSQALDGCNAGKLHFEGAGYFGSTKNPKVIWAGVRKNEWLDYIKKQVDRGVSVLDLFIDDRPFRPHLTLARVKYLKDSRPLIEAVNGKDDSIWGDFELNRVVLYKSQLTSDGPVYSELKSFELIRDAK
ncbi:RNA 2',3'-cyclic phosphodiesterase [Marinilabilia rubra]|uniref:RNA 2',3'-cyclic phosphodiesterase n=1 Tax=Marinilabilia rubra TaxID=2162893 RepID=A0A2U2B887_9BACT|nr:RNA 2',3'-cyclic phosphodiesterase [Marinilabilia rubra]PWD99280.1 RNA 2',3'-cyclic phosphodiesterase [Marinilabilia rubra]